MGLKNEHRIRDIKPVTRKKISDLERFFLNRSTINNTIHSNTQRVDIVSAKVPLEKARI
jgi:Tfp pilus assembly protein PilP